MKAAIFVEIENTILYNKKGLRIPLSNIESLSETQMFDGVSGVLGSLRKSKFKIFGFSRDLSKFDTLEVKRILNSFSGKKFEEVFFFEDASELRSEILDRGKDLFIELRNSAMVSSKSKYIPAFLKTEIKEFFYNKQFFNDVDYDNQSPISDNGYAASLYHEKL